MALRDFENYIRERLLIWDPNADVAPGSAIDTDLIQPLLARIGSDPFTTNLPLFIRERLAQEYPNLATQEGDALVDLLVKPLELILDPLVRETNRIALSQSFKDPTLLTIDEAEALSANLFSARRKGTKARMPVRLYFSTPRSTTINPADYVMVKSGLIFNPDRVQALRMEEMLLNQDGTNYYFDIDTEAELPGDEYNVDADSAVSIANISGVTRVINRFAASGGTPSETAVDFIGRSEDDLSEKSLNTMRGVVSKLVNTFPDVQRIAIVGFQDPEMQRDVLQGGGVGAIMVAGTLLYGTSDAQNGITTTFVGVSDPGVDFAELIGPIGYPTTGFSLTVYGAFSTGDVVVADLPIVRVLSATTLELGTSSILSGSTGKAWALRRNDVQLSNIPGGILFPSTPDGQVTVRGDQVHIGGCTDIYIRGSSLDTTSLNVEAVADDVPEFTGTQGYVDQLKWWSFYGSPVAASRMVVLSDITFFSYLDPSRAYDYKLDWEDGTYRALYEAASKGAVLRILYPASIAGTYGIIRIDQEASDALQHPVVVLDRDITAYFGTENPTTHLPDFPFSWRIDIQMDVDLVEPKETIVSGSDMRTIVGRAVVDTASGIDFQHLGVGAGDVVRIKNGGDVGDYTVASVGGPGYQQITLVDILHHSLSGIQYEVLRVNPDGGVTMPFIRPTKIQLLDTALQPSGVELPYGPPVYAASSSFANNGVGTKVEVRDACLGIVGDALALVGGIPGATVGGHTLALSWRVYDAPGLTAYIQTATVSFAPAGWLPLTSIVQQINAQVANVSGAQVNAAYIVNGSRLGIAPVGPVTQVYATGGVNDAYEDLFGNPVSFRWFTPISSRDIRSDNALIDSFGWSTPTYGLNEKTDGIDVLSGNQVQHVNFTSSWDSWTAVYPTVLLPEYYEPIGRQRLMAAADFRPEAGVIVGVGARSIGTARCYFLAPTTIEFGPDVRFSVVTDSFELEMMPDPENSSVRLPVQPSIVEPKDGIFVTGSAYGRTGRLSSATTSFSTGTVRLGDYVIVRRKTIFGTVDITDPITTTTIGKALDLLVDGESVRIVFAADAGINLTMTGFLQQINDAVGSDIAVWVPQPGGERLGFSADVSVIVVGTLAATAINAIVGFSTTQNTENVSDRFGRYMITKIESEHVLWLWSIDNDIVWNDSDLHHFSIIRPGTQRISSTVMNTQTTHGGLYYADIQLVSRGVGNLYNISSGLEMKPAGYQHYGYHLVARDQNLTFSPVDQPTLAISPIVFPVGVGDDNTNAVRIAGQNLQIDYQTSQLVNDIQQYCSSETERITCDSPLVRHLVPYFVRFDLTYSSGAAASDVQPILEKYITSLFPADWLDASKVYGMVLARGANFIRLPVDLIAVIYDIDRSVWLEWSQDRLNTGRLAAFIPDRITLTRQ